MDIKKRIVKFWNFLREDTWQSWIVSLILLIVFIKLIFFPIMTLITGTALPLVIVESCSMYHGLDFDNWWDKQGAWYESNNITKGQFREYSMKNGINKGDILIVFGRSEPKLGDIIIFNAGSRYPLIHRVISEDPLATKGDHNSDQLKSYNNQLGLDETDIQRKQLVGEAKAKVVPLLGWVKLIWFEPFKSKNDRGFCKLT